MDTLTIELPSQKAQTAFNLRRWAEVITDPELLKIEGRVETDRFGHVLMSPPAAADHGDYQLEIGALLRRMLPNGRASTECPISTADGVRVADVAWASTERLRLRGNRIIYPKAPEICVEVLSPKNSEREMHDKAALYFNAGAREVWFCSQTGHVTFFMSGTAKPLRASRLCPDFPSKVELP